MKNKMRRIDALRHGDNVFFEDDIVEVEFLSNSIRTFKGKIYLIDTLELKLDCSKEYKSDIRAFKYEDILNITHPREEYESPF